MALSPRLQAKPFDSFDRGAKGGGIAVRAARQSQNRLGVTFQHHLRTALRAGAPERVQPKRSHRLLRPPGAVLRNAGRASIVVPAGWRPHGFRRSVSARCEYRQQSRSSGRQLSMSCSIDAPNRGGEDETSIRKPRRAPFCGENHHMGGSAQLGRLERGIRPGRRKLCPQFSSGQPGQSAATRHRCPRAGAGGPSATPAERPAAECAAR
jgi:hypothetical protein